MKYSKDSSVKNNLICYSDADWGNQKDRKSISGVLIKLNENDSPVIWRSTNQSLISLSSCEAEYIALTIFIQKIKFVQIMLTSTKLNVDNVPVHTDSKSAMELIRNPIFSKRSKHVDLKYHFCRQVFEYRSAKLIYMDTSSNIADAFTKVLNCIKFEQFASKLSCVMNCGGVLEVISTKSKYMKKFILMLTYQISYVIFDNNYGCGKLDQIKISPFFKFFCSPSIKLKKCPRTKSVFLQQKLVIFLMFSHINQMNFSVPDLIALMERFYRILSSRALL